MFDENERELILTVFSEMNDQLHGGSPTEYFDVELDMDLSVPDQGRVQAIVRKLISARNNVA